MELGERRWGWRGRSEGNGWRSKERKVLRKTRHREGTSGQEACSVGCMQLRTGTYGGRNQGLSSGDFHSQQKKLRVTGSVLAMDATVFSFPHSCSLQIFSVLLRDGDGNTEAAQTRTLPSEIIWGQGV